jgi:hypothetical protein
MQKKESTHTGLRSGPLSQMKNTHFKIFFYFKKQNRRGFIAA